MKKNNFVRTAEQLPENMPFKKNDIVTYVRYENSEITARDILMLDSIEPDGTIKARASIITTESWDTLKVGKEQSSRMWEQGSKLRYALNYEIRAMLIAFAKKCGI